MTNQMIRELTTTEIDQVSGAAFGVTLGAALTGSAAAFFDLESPFGDFATSIGGGFETGGQIGVTLPSLTDLLGDLF